MKTTKLFRFETTGEIPVFVKSIIDRFDGKQVCKQAIIALDQEITFCVLEIKEAHGNLNASSKEAWLSPRNNDGSFNVRIYFN
jgi:hypothetical protein